MECDYCGTAFRDPLPQECRGLFGPWGDDALCPICAEKELREAIKRTRFDRQGELLTIAFTLICTGAAILLCILSALTIVQLQDIIVAWIIFSLPGLSAGMRRSREIKNALLGGRIDRMAYFLFSAFATPLTLFILFVLAAAAVPRQFTRAWRNVRMQKIRLAELYAALKSVTHLALKQDLAAYARYVSPIRRG